MKLGSLKKKRRRYEVACLTGWWVQKKGLLRTPPIGLLLTTGKAAIRRHSIHDSPPSSKPHQQKQSPRFNLSLPTSTTPKPHITNPIFLPTQTPISSHNTKTPQITNLKTLPPKLPLIQTNYWVILKLIEHRFRFTNKGKSP